MMSTYEIVRRDGTVSRMRLMDATDPYAEVAKWSPEEQENVIEIRPCAEFNDRPARINPPVSLSADSSAPEIKEAIFGLAETIGMTRKEAETSRDSQEARIAALEAEISALKGVVR